jgi:hypothetical protein
MRLQPSIPWHQMRFNHLRRREFITLLGSTPAWALGAHAQQVSKPARLGYIWIGAKDSEHSTRDGLRQGLRDLGYVEGRDFFWKNATRSQTRIDCQKLSLSWCG